MPLHKATVMAVDGGASDAALLASKGIQNSRAWRPLIRVFPTLYQRSGHVGKIDWYRRGAGRDDDLLEDIGIGLWGYGGADGIGSKEAGSDRYEIKRFLRRAVGGLRSRGGGGRWLGYYVVFGGG